MSKKNPFAPKTLASVRKKAAPKKEAATESVVDGTIKEIMEWVGDDRDRAQEALDEENKKDGPRATLVKNLTAILEDDSDRDTSA